MMEEYNKDILDFRGMVQYSSMINKLCDYQPRTASSITAIEVAA